LSFWGNVRSSPKANIAVHDMKDINVARRAKSLGILLVPSVVIDTKPADCRAGRCVDEQVLQAASLGKAFWRVTRSHRFWHLADIPLRSANVRFWGKADIGAWTEDFCS
jgi:hypothetical protein